MTRYLRVGAVAALLCATALLAGCPPGAAGGQSQQNMPSGMKSPPGLETGGAQTVMGSTTIIAPNDSILLVRYSNPPPFRDHAKFIAPPEPPWQSCRRVIPSDTWVLVEGLNFNGRDPKAEKDVNQLLPASGLAYFYWKYELKPAPPPEATKKETPGKRGR